MMPGPSRITLDQESFKALASDVRVGILKTLDGRRQTVTDLSNLMALSKPTLLEHLDKLRTAGLVKRVDEGRKWIYYELSDKGRKILHPERVSIVVALCSSAGLAAIGVLSLLSTTGALSAPTTGRADYASPSIEFAGAEVPWLTVIFLSLAAAAAASALVLRWVGKRRRERFFHELIAA